MSLMGEAGCTPPGSAVGHAEQACAVGWDIVLYVCRSSLCPGLPRGRTEGS